MGKSKDGRPGPKMWTSSTPPRPFSRRVFDAPTLVGLVAVVACTVLLALVPAFHWAWTAGVAGGIVLLVVHSVREIRRWWDERRWRNSPAPTDTLDDL